MSRTGGNFGRSYNEESARIGCPFWSSGKTLGSSDEEIYLRRTERYSHHRSAKTLQAIKDAYDVVRATVASGKTVLFVGTKKQAQQAIQKEAERCGMFFVNNRWLGGMLTNFSTIKKSLLRLKKLEKMEVDGTFENLTKKEDRRSG